MGALLFAPPILGPWASDPKTKKWGGAILGTPTLGPSGSLALFCTFGLLSISRPPGPHTHTYRYPTYRPQTHLSWGKPKLNSFFSFLIPHTGGNLHLGGPTYGSRVIHIIYTRWNRSPTQGWSPTSTVTPTP